MTTQDPNPGAGQGQPGNQPAGTLPPAAGQAPPADRPAGGLYRPEGLPDQFHGQSDRETIDKMFGALKGFREKQATAEPVPKTVDEYRFEWSETVKGYVDTLEKVKDPLFQGVKEDLLAAGIPSAQANKLMNGLLGRLLTMDVLEKPIDIEAEKARLAPPEARNLPPVERDQAAQVRISNNVAFVNQLVQDKFDPGAAKVIAAELAAFPELNDLVEFMRRSTGAPALGGQPAPAITRADLDARIADPRNEVGNPAYSASFARETTRLYQEFHGATKN